MKKLIMIVSLMMAFSMMAAQAVMANTISTGDYVKLTAYNSLDNAGIMTYDVSHDATSAHSVAFSYETFCIQENVYIWANTWYFVADVSNTVGKYTSTTGDGPLAGVIDYLFYRYKSGTGAYDLSSQANQADFQKFLWSIQGTGPSYSPPSTDKWYIDYLAYNDPNNGLQHSWGTKVINIAGESHDVTGKPVYVDIQNQLYNQVPEPTTILLFGLGLIGVAGIRRKIKK